jgi:hypothetical protein
VTPWLESLRRLEALDPAVIVPGQGPVMHDKSYLERTIELFAAVIDQVHAALERELVTLKDVQAAVNVDRIGIEYAPASRSPRTSASGSGTSRRRRCRKLSTALRTSRTSMFDPSRTALRRRFALFSLALLCRSAARSQSPQALTVPADSPRWDLQGEAKPAEYLGRKSLLLDGGAAILKDFDMRDAVIDVDVATPGDPRLFRLSVSIDGGRRQRRVGLSPPAQVRASGRHAVHPGAQHRRQLADLQRRGLHGRRRHPKETWFHLRLEVAGAQAKLYVKDMDRPALVMPDLKSGVQKGLVALHDLTGATYFSNFEIRATPDAPWQRHLPPMPAEHADPVEAVAGLRRSAA